jgi:cell wall-associated NlpC family hydrolase
VVEADSKLISAAQSLSTKPAMRAASAWSHAAIYIGSDLIVDATLALGAVDKQSVWSYCHHRRITVRRLDGAAVPSHHRAAVAAAALRHLGEPYSAIQSFLGKVGWPTAQQPNSGALYCSTFVALAIAEATGIQLAADPALQPFFPAMLVNHPDLSVVDLMWRNI